MIKPNLSFKDEIKKTMWVVSLWRGLKIESCFNVKVISQKRVVFNWSGFS